jgi:hypothetical protein
MDTVNSGEEVGDAECAKRKCVATSSDTGKENEKPKQVHFPSLTGEIVIVPD